MNSFNNSDQADFDKIASGLNNVSNEIKSQKSILNRISDGIGGVGSIVKSGIASVGRGANRIYQANKQDFGPDTNEMKKMVANAAVGPIGAAIQQAMNNAGISFSGMIKKSISSVMNSFHGHGSKGLNLDRLEKIEQNGVQLQGQELQAINSGTAKQIQNDNANTSKIITSINSLEDSLAGRGNRRNGQGASRGDRPVTVSELRTILASSPKQNNGSGGSGGMSVGRSPGSMSSIQGRVATGQNNPADVAALLCELIKTQKEFAQNFTDPNAPKGGGILHTLWDLGKDLTGVSLLFSGRYAKDIKRSQNPMETITDALIKIYEWERIGIDLSRRQLNEIIKAVGGAPQKYVGHEGIATTVLKRAAGKLKQSYDDSSFAKIPILGKLGKAGLNLGSFFLGFNDEDWKDQMSAKWYNTLTGNKRENKHLNNDHRVNEFRDAVLGSDVDYADYGKIQRKKIMKFKGEDNVKYDQVLKDPDIARSLRDLNTINTHPDLSDKDRKKLLKEATKNLKQSIKAAEDEYGLSGLMDHITEITGLGGGFLGTGHSLFGKWFKPGHQTLEKGKTFDLKDFLSNSAQQDDDAYYKELEELKKQWETEKDPQKKHQAGLKLTKAHDEAQKRLEAGKENTVKKVGDSIIPVTIVQPNQLILSALRSKIKGVPQQNFNVFKDQLAALQNIKDILEGKGVAGGVVTSPSEAAEEIAKEKKEEGGDIEDVENGNARGEKTVEEAHLDNEERIIALLGDVAGNTKGLHLKGKDDKEGGFLSGLTSSLGSVIKGLGGFILDHPIFTTLAGILTYLTYKMFGDDEENPDNPKSTFEKLEDWYKRPNSVTNPTTAVLSAAHPYAGGLFQTGDAIKNMANGRRDLGSIQLTSGLSPFLFGNPFAPFFTSLAGTMGNIFVGKEIQHIDGKYLGPDGEYHDIKLDQSDHNIEASTMLLGYDVSKIIKTTKDFVKKAPWLLADNLGSYSADQLAYVARELERTTNGKFTIGFQNGKCSIVSTEAIGKNGITALDNSVTAPATTAPKPAATPATAPKPAPAATTPVPAPKPITAPKPVATPATAPKPATPVNPGGHYSTAHFDAPTRQFYNSLTNLSDKLRFAKLPKPAQRMIMSLPSAQRRFALNKLSYLDSTNQLDGFLAARAGQSDDIILRGLREVRLPNTTTPIAPAAASESTSIATTAKHVTPPPAPKPTNVVTEAAETNAARAAAPKNVPTSAVPKDVIRQASRHVNRAISGKALIRFLGKTLGVGLSAVESYMYAEQALKELSDGQNKYAYARGAQALIALVGGISLALAPLTGGASVGLAFLLIGVQTLMDGIINYNKRKEFIAEQKNYTKIRQMLVDANFMMILDYSKKVHSIVTSYNNSPEEVREQTGTKQKFAQDLADLYSDYLKKFGTKINIAKQGYKADKKYQKDNEDFIESLRAFLIKEYSDMHGEDKLHFGHPLVQHLLAAHYIIWLEKQQTTEGEFNDKLDEYDAEIASAWDPTYDEDMKQINEMQFSGENAEVKRTILKKARFNIRKQKVEAYRSAPIADRYNYGLVEDNWWNSYTQANEGLKATTDSMVNRRTSTVDKHNYEFLIHHGYSNKIIEALGASDGAVNAGSKLDAMTRNYVKELKEQILRLNTDAECRKTAIIEAVNYARDHADFLQRNEEKFKKYEFKKYQEICELDFNHPELWYPDFRIKDNLFEELMACSKLDEIFLIDKSHNTVTLREKGILPNLLLDCVVDTDGLDYGSSVLRKAYKPFYMGINRFKGLVLQYHIDDYLISERSWNKTYDYKYFIDGCKEICTITQDAALRGYEHILSLFKLYNHDRGWSFHAYDLDTGDQHIVFMNMVIAQNILLDIYLNDVYFGRQRYAEVDSNGRPVSNLSNYLAKDVRSHLSLSNEDVAEDAEFRHQRDIVDSNVFLANPFFRQKMGNLLNKIKQGSPRDKDGNDPYLDWQLDTSAKPNYAQEETPPDGEEYDSPPGAVYNPEDLDQRARGRIAEFLYGIGIDPWDNEGTDTTLGSELLETIFSDPELEKLFWRYAAMDITHSDLDFLPEDFKSSIPKELMDTSDGGDKLSVFYRKYLYRQLLQQAADIYYKKHAEKFKKLGDVKTLSDFGKKFAAIDVNDKTQTAQILYGDSNLNLQDIPEYQGLNAVDIDWDKIDFDKMIEDMHLDPKSAQKLKQSKSTFFQLCKEYLKTQFAKGNRQNPNVQIQGAVEFALSKLGITIPTEESQTAESSDSQTIRHALGGFSLNSEDNISQIPYISNRDIGSTGFSLTDFQMRYNDSDTEKFEKGGAKVSTKLLNKATYFPKENAIGGEAGPELKIDNLLGKDSHLYVPVTPRPGNFTDKLISSVKDKLKVNSEGSSDSTGPDSPESRYAIDVLSGQVAENLSKKTIGVKKHKTGANTMQVPAWVRNISDSIGITGRESKNTTNEIVKFRRGAEKFANDLRSGKINTFGDKKGFFSEMGDLFNRGVDAIKEAIEPDFDWQGGENGLHERALKYMKSDTRDEKLESEINDRITALSKQLESADANDPKTKKIKNELEFLAGKTDDKGQRIAGTGIRDIHNKFVKEHKNSFADSTQYFASDYASVKSDYGRDKDTDKLGLKKTTIKLFGNEYAFEGDSAAYVDKLFGGEDGKDSFIKNLARVHQDDPDSRSYLSDLQNTLNNDPAFANLGADQKYSIMTAAAEYFQERYRSTDKSHYSQDVANNFISNVSNIGGVFGKVKDIFGRKKTPAKPATPGKPVTPVPAKSEKSSSGGTAEIDEAKQKLLEEAKGTQRVWKLSDQEGDEYKKDLAFARKHGIKLGSYSKMSHDILSTYITEDGKIRAEDRLQTLQSDNLRQLRAARLAYEEQNGGTKSSSQYNLEAVEQDYNNLKGTFEQKIRANNDAYDEDYARLISGLQNKIDTYNSNLERDNPFHKQPIKESAEQMFQRMGQFGFYVDGLSGMDTWDLQNFKRDRRKLPENIEELLKVRDMSEEQMNIDRILGMSSVKDYQSLYKELERARMTHEVESVMPPPQIIAQYLNSKQFSSEKDIFEDKVLQQLPDIRSDLLTTHYINKYGIPTDVKDLPEGAELGSGEYLYGLGDTLKDNPWLAYTFEKPEGMTDEDYKKKQKEIEDKVKQHIQQKAKESDTAKSQEDATKNLAPESIKGLNDKLSGEEILSLPLREGYSFVSGFGGNVDHMEVGGKPFDPSELKDIEIRDLYQRTQDPFARAFLEAEWNKRHPIEQKLDNLIKKEGADTSAKPPKKLAEGGVIGGSEDNAIDALSTIVAQNLKQEAPTKFADGGIGSEVSNIMDQRRKGVSKYKLLYGTYNIPELLQKMRNKEELSEDEIDYLIEDAAIQSMSMYRSSDKSEEALDQAANSSFIYFWRNYGDYFRVWKETPRGYVEDEEVKDKFWQLIRTKIQKYDTEEEREKRFKRSETPFDRLKTMSSSQSLGRAAGLSQAYQKSPTVQSQLAKQKPVPSVTQSVKNAQTDSTGVSSAEDNTENPMDQKRYEEEKSLEEKMKTEVGILDAAGTSRKDSDSTNSANATSTSSKPDSLEKIVRESVRQSSNFDSSSGSDRSVERTTSSTTKTETHTTSSSKQSNTSSIFKAQAEARKMLPDLLKIGFHDFKKNGNHLDSYYKVSVMLSKSINKKFGLKGTDLQRVTDDVDSKLKIELFRMISRDLGARGGDYRLFCDENDKTYVIDGRGIKNSFSSSNSSETELSESELSNIENKIMQEYYNKEEKSDTQNVSTTNNTSNATSNTTTSNSNKESSSVTNNSSTSNSNKESSSVTNNSSTVNSGTAGKSGSSSSSTLMKSAKSVSSYSQRKEQCKHEIAVLLKKLVEEDGANPMYIVGETDEKYGKQIKAIFDKYKIPVGRERDRIWSRFQNSATSYMEYLQGIDIINLTKKEPKTPSQSSSSSITSTAKSVSDAISTSSQESTTSSVKDAISEASASSSSSSSVSEFTETLTQPPKPSDSELQEKKMTMEANSDISSVQEELYKCAKQSLDIAYSDYQQNKDYFDAKNKGVEHFYNAASSIVSKVQDSKTKELLLSAVRAQFESAYTNRILKDLGYKGGAAKLMFDKNRTAYLEYNYEPGSKASERAKEIQKREEELAEKMYAEMMGDSYNSSNTTSNSNSTSNIASTAQSFATSQNSNTSISSTQNLQQSIKSVLENVEDDPSYCTFLQEYMKSKMDASTSSSLNLSEYGDILEQKIRMDHPDWSDEMVEAKRDQIMEKYRNDLMHYFEVLSESKQNDGLTSQITSDTSSDRSTAIETSSSSAVDSISQITDSISDSSSTSSSNKSSTLSKLAMFGSSMLSKITGGGSGLSMLKNMFKGTSFSSIGGDSEVSSIHDSVYSGGSNNQAAITSNISNIISQAAANGNDIIVGQVIPAFSTSARQTAMNTTSMSTVSESRLSEGSSEQIKNEIGKSVQAINSSNMNVVKNIHVGGSSRHGGTVINNYDVDQFYKVIESVGIVK